MSKFIEPPTFVSDNKSYAEYKADLQMWSRISSLDKKIQAELVVYRLEGHPSRIKEKIITQLGDKLQDNDDGIRDLLTFLDTIYTKDDMADAWDKFSEFSCFNKKSDQSMSDFIAEWENCYYKLKKVGCDYSDMILAFKLLKDSKLNDMETKLVLTGVDYTTGKASKNLLQQIKDSLKKFKGRSIILDDDKRAVKVDDTLVSEMEDVLISKGWKPPRKERRRSRSVSPRRFPKNSSYKGKKNPLGEDHKPRKCFKCKCDHTENCNCPCVYHFADKCREHEKTKPVLGFFVKSNILSKPESAFITEHDSVNSDDDLVLVVKESLEELVLLSIEKSEALIDCACPTTVTGKKWMEEFYDSLSTEDKMQVKTVESDKVYKFGGGEKRKSLGKVIFPCHLAGKNVKMTTEVIEADFPLLLGNTMLKKTQAVLFLSQEKAMIMGTEVKMKETNSGHFSLRIEQPKQCLDYVQNDCFMTNYMNSIEDELSLKDVQKLHQYFGHVSRRKLEKLIKNSNKLTEGVKKHLDYIELHCKSCKFNQKAKPRPAVALPRASKFNQVVSLDLKEYPEGKYKYILYAVDHFSRLTVGAFLIDKKPSTVGAALMEKWIAPMGRMETLHSDCGGEFRCEEMTALAEYLGVKVSFTAAYSPHQNGINERNHEIVDNMMKKMRMEDPTMPCTVALTWGLVAKNTLQNVSGYSSFQIVFGEAPKLPSVYTAGPPGLEEVIMSKAVADHINALHLAREAYIFGESDRILAGALKQKIYRRGQDINPGDWICYKNKDKWEGPVKVTTKDGKSLYAVRAGKLLTINSDHADLTMFEG